MVTICWTILELDTFCRVLVFTVTQAVKAQDNITGTAGAESTVGKSYSAPGLRKQETGDEQKLLASQGCVCNGLQHNSHRSSGANKQYICSFQFAVTR